MRQTAPRDEIEAGLFLVAHAIRRTVPGIDRRHVGGGLPITARLPAGVRTAAGKVMHEVMKARAVSESAGQLIDRKADAVPFI